MKRFFLAAGLALLAGHAAAGVSVTIGEPGFYGHIDIGGMPPPRLVYAQPMIIERGPAMPPPVYLHVPPGHSRDWRRYCYEYDACDRPVYFVQPRWYSEVYVPEYRSRHGRDYDDERRGRGHAYGRERKYEREYEDDRRYDRRYDSRYDRRYEGRNERDMPAPDYYERFRYPR